MTTKAELMTMLDERDALDGKIDKAMTDLGLDAKGAKALRKAADKVASAQRTLEALMSEGIATPAQAAEAAKK